MEDLDLLWENIKNNPQDIKHLGKNLLFGAIIQNRLDIILWTKNTEINYNQLNENGENIFQCAYKTKNTDLLHELQQLAVKDFPELACNKCGRVYNDPLAHIPCGRMYCNDCWFVMKPGSLIERQCPKCDGDIDFLHIKSAPVSILIQLGEN